MITKIKKIVRYTTVFKSFAILKKTKPLGTQAEVVIGAESLGFYMRTSRLLVDERTLSVILKQINTTYSFKKPKNTFALVLDLLYLAEDKKPSIELKEVKLLGKRGEFFEKNKKLLLSLLKKLSKRKLIRFKDFRGLELITYY